MKRKKKGITRLSCGCTHNSTHWLNVCEADQTDHYERSERWHNDCSKTGLPFIRRALGHASAK